MSEEKELNTQLEEEGIKRAEKKAKKKEQIDAKVKKEANKNASNYRSGWYGVLLGIISLVFFGLIFIPAFSLTAPVGATLDKTSINLFEATMGFTLKITIDTAEYSEKFVAFYWFGAVSIILVLVASVFYCFMNNSLIFGFLGVACNVASGILLIILMQTFSLTYTSSASQTAFNSVAVGKSYGLYITFIFEFIVAILGVVFIVLMINKSRKDSYNAYLHGKKLQNY